MALNNGKPAPKFRPNAISLRVNKRLCPLTDIGPHSAYGVNGPCNLR